MVENTECLNNNPEDSKMVFVDYEIMNPNK
jgi:hypothetical protein